MISGSEIAEDKPDDWQLEAWLPRKPTRADKAAIAALFGDNAPDLAVEQLPEMTMATQTESRAVLVPGA